MMAEPIRYVIVCGCAGDIEAVGYVNDNRPIDGGIEVLAPGPEAGQIISAAGYHPEIENWRAPGGWVAGKWADRNVNQTVWGWDEPHVGWVIRCGRCQQQAQMSRATLVDVVDRMAANLNPDALMPAPNPVSADDAAGSYDADGWFTPESTPPVTKWERRFVIQLGVLVRESQRNW